MSYIRTILLLFKHNRTILYLNPIDTHDLRICLFPVRHNTDNLKVYLFDSILCACLGNTSHSIASMVCRVCAYATVSIYLSVSFSVFVSMSVSFVCVSFFLSFFLFLSLSLSLSLFLSLPLSLCLSLCVSVALSFSELVLFPAAFLSTFPLWLS